MANIQQVGYKLINVEDGTEINQWGGNYGYCPDIPNPIVLPNGDQLCAAEVNVEYYGYKLIPWMMEEPPKPTPEEKLASMGLTIDDLKTLLGI